MTDQKTSSAVKWLDKLTSKSAPTNYTTDLMEFGKFLDDNCYELNLQAAKNYVNAWKITVTNWVTHFPHVT